MEFRCIIEVYEAIAKKYDADITVRDRVRMPQSRRRVVSDILFPGLKSGERLNNGRFITLPKASSQEST